MGQRDCGVSYQLDGFLFAPEDTFLRVGAKHWAGQLAYLMLYGMIVFRALCAGDASAGGIP